MRATLPVILFFVCIPFATGRSTEELIFEPPYVQAAKAAGQGDVATLERLIRQGLDVNYEGKETRAPWGKDTVTLLLWAALSNSAKGAEALLKAGADPNKATRRGMTPLMYASGSKSDELFELLLIRYNADPNRTFRRPPETALTVALQERKNLGEKRFNRADMLLKHGADINLDIDRGQTATIGFSILGD